MYIYIYVPACVSVIWLDRHTNRKLFSLSLSPPSTHFLELGFFFEAHYAFECSDDIGLPCSFAYTTSRQATGVGEGRRPSTAAQLLPGPLKRMMRYYLFLRRVYGVTMLLGILARWMARLFHGPFDRLAFHLNSRHLHLP